MTNHRTPSTELDFADLRATSGALSSTRLAEPDPFGNVLHVRCPQCGYMVQVADVALALVKLKPTASGDGWQAFDLGVTAIGNAQHIHNEEAAPHAR